MSAAAVKTINQADKFLTGIWQLFPIILAKRNKKEFDIEVNRLLKLEIDRSSDELCNLIVQGIILKNPLTAGGSALVYNLTINEDQENQPIYTTNISLKPGGGYEIFYLPIILKTSKINGKTEEFLYNVINGNILTFNDPLTEVVFGSMVSHLYDIGLSPFFTKYFGYYNCGIIIEKSSFEIGYLLNRYDSAGYYNEWSMANLDSSVLINILFQVIYSLYIGKKYIGFTHFDLQYRNVMITYTDRRLINDVTRDTIDYIYHGVNMVNVDYILFVVDGELGGKNYIAIKYNGIMAKIIDYGLCSAFLNKSRVSNYYKDVLITTDWDSMKHIFNNVQPVLTDADINTIDIHYLLTNLYQQAKLELDINAGESEEDLTLEFQSVVNELNEFTTAFYDDPSVGNMENYLLNNPTKQIGYRTNRNGQNVRDHFVRDHNTGINLSKFSDPRELLIGLMRYCNSLGHYDFNKNISIDGKNISANFYYLEEEIGQAELGDFNCLILDENIKYARSMNNVEKFIDSQNNVEQYCSYQVNDNELFNRHRIRRQDRNQQTKSNICARYINDKKKYDPDRILTKRIYSPMVNSPALNKSTGRFDGVINLANYPGVELIRSNNGSIEIYNIQINPAALRLNPSYEGSLYYKSHQNWLNFKNIENTEDGRPVHIVNLHAITFNPSDFVHRLNYNTDLWSASTINLPSSFDGFTINCGYFLTKSNLIIGMTDNIITQDDVDKKRPLGYCYNYEKVGTNENGTYLPIPKPYRPYFAVIYGTEDGRIHFTSYEHFIGNHDCVDQNIVYLLENDKYYVTTQKVIKMTKIDGNEDVLGSRPSRRYIEYIWAFCAGPILLMNDNVLFNNEVVLTKQFQIDDTDVPAIQGTVKPPNFTRYRLSPLSTDYYMFKTISNPGSHFSGYGARHSNRYGVHNAICLDREDRLVFVLIEGRGYDAPGLDRVQVAYLLKDLGMKHAVSLDGGFSANAVIKINGSERKFVINDPEKREIGVSISFMRK